MHPSYPSAVDLKIMSSVIIARQPILERNQNVSAFEILFRSSAEQTAAPVILDDQHASVEVTSILLNEIGLNNVVDDRLAFINISYDFIVNRLAYALPKERVVLEVLENTPPTPEVLDELKELSVEGYTIALDDVVYSESLDSLIEIADIIKVELPAIADGDLPDQVKKLRAFGGQKKLLAEKVETHEMFQRCLDLGFDLFQGYYFCKPETVKSQKLAENKMASLRLLKALQNPDVDIDELSILLQTDPILCVKLLKFVNSSKFHLKRNIDSIRSATTIVGLKKIKSFAQIATIANLGCDKPSPLIFEALFRAKMCELLAVESKRESEKYFTTGLLSLVDAILDQPMEEALSPLSLDSDITDAIQNHQGPMSDVIELVRTYNNFDAEVPAHPTLTIESIQNAYLMSLAWAKETMDELGNCN